MIHNHPLGILTFWTRNWKRAVPIVGVIVLAVLLVSGIVSMMNSIPHSIRTIYSYSKHFVAVTPRGDPEMTPKIVDQLTSESPIPIERIVLCRATGRQVMSIVGKWPFAVIGMKPDDAHYYVKRMGAAKIEGRMPNEASAEAIISEPVARNLRLKLGDSLQKPDDNENYSPYPIKIVGIAQTDEWLMVGDYEYQKANHFPPVDGVLAFAKDLEQQDKLDHWAFEKFKGQRASVLAFFDLNNDTDLMFRTLYKILNVVIGTLVLVVTIMMGMLINIYQSQRVLEFGLLQALGYTKKQLLRRAIWENLIIVGIGWVLGLFSAYGLLVLVDRQLMLPNAYAMETFDLQAFSYTIPVPLAIIAVATLTIALRFRKFDPVGVVERRLV